MDDEENNEETGEQEASQKSNANEIEDIKKHIAQQNGDLQDLKKRRENKEQEVKNKQREHKSKRDQLAQAQAELMKLRCALEKDNEELHRIEGGKYKESGRIHIQGSNPENEVNALIVHNLKELQKCLDKPVLEGLATNYNTHFFQMNKIASPYITVMLVDIPIDKLFDLEKIEGSVSTFRISKTTNFRTLWQVACQFWGRNTGDYRLLDNTFSDLAAYEDTIENYISVIKEMQREKVALVYLVHSPKCLQQPHPDTYPLIQLGKKGAGKGKDYDNSINKKKVHPYDEILKKTCKGLLRYQEPIITQRQKKSQKKNEDQYLRTSPTYHIYTFILTIISFALIFASMLCQEESQEPYFISKLTENAFPPVVSNSSGNFSPTYTGEETPIIENFTMIKYQINSTLRYNLMTSSASMDFAVGKKLYFLMKKTTKTSCKRDISETYCPTPFSTDADDVNKTSIGDGSEYYMNYHTVEENQVYFNLKGELGSYKGDGFLKSYDLSSHPDISALYSELETMENNGFFSNYNLAIVFFYCYYFAEADLFVFSYTLYENTFAGHVVMTTMKSFPFRANIQETYKEKLRVMLEVIIFCISCGFVAICILELVKTYYKDY